MKDLKVQVLKELEPVADAIIDEMNDRFEKG